MAAPITTIHPEAIELKTLEYNPSNAAIRTIAETMALTTLQLHLILYLPKQ